MKQYAVYFSEPVAYSHSSQKWDKETRKYVDVEETETADTFTFFTLTAAKKLIKANMDKYKGSCITKIWANGDWENLGEISLKGTNKTFVANTKQTVSNY